MCGRFSLSADKEEILGRFGIDPDFNYIPRYNIAPGQDSLIITNQEPKKAVSARWGLIPSWAKDEHIAYKTINAKAETIDERPAYRNSFKSKRCLVIADGFYEWKTTPQGKIPFRFTIGRVFAFAGLYDIWNDIITFTIITVPPNDAVKAVHERMPTILLDESSWLKEESPEILKSLLIPYNGTMESYQVSKLVNDPKNDSVKVIEKMKGLGDYF